MDVDGIEVKTEHSLSAILFFFLLQIAAEWQSEKIVSDMKAEVCHWISLCRKIAPIDIHQHLLNVYEYQTVDVNTVR